MSETLASAVIAADQVLRRIRGEYLEMPGLRLTHQQARRLWGLDQPTCERLLDLLVEARFLRRTNDAMYVRLTGDPCRAPPLRMAGAELANISRPARFDRAG